MNYPVLVAAVLPVVLFLMAVYLAVAVQHDAAGRRRARKSVFLIGHWGWFFVVLVSGGFLGAFAYWIIHYSSLRHLPHSSD